MVIVKCEMCAVDFYKCAWQTARCRFNFCSRSCWSSFRKNNAKKIFSGNTGLIISEYQSIHRWIRKTFGKASKCEHCDVKGHSKYEWALKNGAKYEKNIDNYIQLCPSCHRKCDETELSRMNRKNAKLKRIDLTIQP